MDEASGENFRYYLRWLAARVKGTVQYSKLLSILHNVEFEWVIPEDEHRESDGRRMRSIFAEAKGFEAKDGDLLYPASFLEVLISLSESMGMNILYDDENPDGEPYVYFWELLDNCGLANYDNAYLSSMTKSEAEMFVRAACERVMLRLYDRDGRGGLFPIPRSRKDQRKIELWYQMNEYILATGRA